MDREVTELVVSEWGRKRFLGWERLFEKYPLAGVVPHTAASKMVQADAEVKVHGVQKPEPEFSMCAD